MTTQAGCQGHQTPGDMSSASGASERAVQQPGTAPVTVPPGLEGQLWRILVRALAPYARDGGQLQPQIDGFLRNLRAAETRTMSASEPPHDPPDSIDSVDRARVTAGKAADVVGYTPAHVRRLARQQMITGERAGRDWFVDLASVIDYAKGERHDQTGST